jgi:hypothetical protein
MKPIVVRLLEAANLYPHSIDSTYLTYVKYSIRPRRGHAGPVGAYRGMDFTEYIT